MTYAQRFQGIGIAGAFMMCALFWGACDGGDDGGGSGGSSGDSGSTGGTGAGGGGGNIISCTSGTEPACFELTVPPGGEGAATQACTDQSGTPGTACSTTDVIGECKSTPHYFYYTGYNGLDQAEKVCTALGGQWVVP